MTKHELCLLSLLFLVLIQSCRPAATTISKSGELDPEETPCDSGQYDHDNDSTTICQVCPAGSYCEAGSSGAATCPAGTYGPESGSVSVSECLACPAGTYGPESGLVAVSECLACPSGSYSVGDAGQCVTHSDCPVGQGKYDHSAASDGTCKPCNDTEAGTSETYSASSGTLGCIAWQECSDDDQWVNQSAQTPALCLNDLNGCTEALAENGVESGVFDLVWSGAASESPIRGYCTLLPDGDDTDGTLDTDGWLLVYNAIGKEDTNADFWGIPAAKRLEQASLDDSNSDPSLDAPYYHGELYTLGLPEGSSQYCKAPFWDCTTSETQGTRIFRDVAQDAPDAVEGLCGNVSEPEEVILTTVEVSGFNRGDNTSGACSGDPMRFVLTEGCEDGDKVCETLFAQSWVGSDEDCCPSDKVDNMPAQHGVCDDHRAYLLMSGDSTISPWDREYEMYLDRSEGDWDGVRGQLQCRHQALGCEATEGNLYGTISSEYSSYIENSVWVPNVAELCRYRPSVSREVLEAKGYRIVLYNGDQFQDPENVDGSMSWTCTDASNTSITTLPYRYFSSPPREDGDGLQPEVPIIGRFDNGEWVDAVENTTWANCEMSVDDLGTDGADNRWASPEFPKWASSGELWCSEGMLIREDGFFPDMGPIISCGWGTDIPVQRISRFMKW